MSLADKLTTAAKLSKSPLGIALEGIILQFNTKFKSEEVYVEIIPVIKDHIAQGHSTEFPKLKGLLIVLAKLPPSGARARNFKKRYLSSTATLLELPDNPDKLGYGYWW